MKRKICLSLLISAVAAMAVLGADDPKGHGDARGLTVPEAWRGTWEVTVTYRDRETGATVATEVTTAAICPGEPILPPLLDTAVHCSGEANERKIGVLCGAKHSLRPGFNMFVGATLVSRRDGDVWQGTGLWAVKGVGRGEHINYSEEVVVSGRRVSHAAACDGERLSLVLRFFAHSELVPFLGGRN